MKKMFLFIIMFALAINLASAGWFDFGTPPPSATVSSGNYTNGTSDGTGGWTNNSNSTTTILRVGINTTSPSYALDVSGNSNFSMIRSNNGYDINIIGAPVAPTTSKAIPGTGLGIGVYRYKVSYITALGESTPIGYNAITTVAGNQTINLTLPVSSDSRVIGRKIYRGSVGEASSLTKNITTINNNVDTFYIDNMSDVIKGASNYEAYYKIDSTSDFITIKGTKAMTLDTQLTSFGFSAGAAINQGGENTYFGYRAGSNNQNSSRQTFIGSGAGTSATGSNLFCGGVNACVNAYSNDSVYLGSFTGANSLGDDTVIIGGHAGYMASNYISGDGNTCVGRYCMSGTVTLNFTGHQNTFLGFYSGQQSQGQNMDADHSIAIGDNAYTTKDGQAVIGALGYITETILRGKIGIGTINVTQTLTINGSANISGTIIMTNSSPFNFTSEVWNDIPVSGLQLASGVFAPTLTDWNGTLAQIPCYAGTVRNEYSSGSLEMPHSWKEGTNLSLHMHSAKSTTGAGNYTFNLNGVFMNGTGGASIIYNKNLTVIDGGQWVDSINGFTDLAPTDMTTGSTFSFRLTRLQDNTADNYTDCVGIKQVSAHYIMDTLGSSTEFNK